MHYIVSGGQFQTQRQSGPALITAERVLNFVELSNTQFNRGRSLNVPFDWTDHSDACRVNATPSGMVKSARGAQSHQGCAMTSRSDRHR